MASQLRDIIEFFEQLGVYDVVLPFLLTFTIVFAIFEKTKILGTEHHGGHEVTKKNLNAMAAFVIGFLVIASSRLVEIITNVSANAVVLLFLAVLFLLLYGSFQKEDKHSVFLDGPWKLVFAGIMFIGIIGIFLNELQTDDGDSWLEAIGNYLGGYDNDRLIGSILVMLVVVGFMAFIVQDNKPSGSGGGGGGGH